MTIQELLAECAARKLSLSMLDGRVRVTGKPEQLTKPLIDVLRLRRDDIIHSMQKEQEGTPDDQNHPESDTTDPNQALQESCGETPMEHDPQ